MKLIQALSILASLVLSTEATTNIRAAPRPAEGSSPAEDQPDNLPAAADSVTTMQKNDQIGTNQKPGTFFKAEHTPLAKNSTSMDNVADNQTFDDNDGAGGRKLSMQCHDFPLWSDSDGDDCNWYASTPGACENYGDGYENLGHTANTACCACKESSATVSILETADIFRNSEEVLEMIGDFRDARFQSARVQVCKTIQNTVASNLMSGVAQALDSTITVVMGFDVTVVGFDAAFAIEFIWGEDGQFACARATSYGLSVGLLGAGASFTVAVSSRQLMGGWATVGADLRDPAVCIALGYSPGIYGVAATAVLNPEMIGRDVGIDHLKDALGRVSEDFSEMRPKEAILEALSYVVPDGLLNVGVEVNVGADYLDSIGVEFVVPDINFAVCDEVLTYCDGVGCAEKLMETPLEDGELCVPFVTCDDCENEATSWWGKLGATACGDEPCFSDGTSCFATSSCVQCCNGYEWWDSDLGFHCGEEACWEDGRRCVAGATCDSCCDGKSSYWWSKLFTACGDEPCFSRGTTCFPGSSCNNCCGSYDWDWSDWAHVCD